MGLFPLRHRVQIGSGAHPAFYPMSTEDSIPAGEADQSPASNVEIKNVWSYT